MTAYGTTVITVRCNYCSHQRSPFEVHRLQSGVVICWHCMEWHAKAISALGTGVPPPGCQECGTTFAALKDDGRGNVPMALHVKDGVYQVLCLSCSEVYERKRQDLFRGTRYGWERKLDGSK